MINHKYDPTNYLKHLATPVITDNQKRYLINQFNSMNIRRREPAELDIPRENPMKLRDMITNYKNKQKLNVKQLALFFNSNEDEFLSKYS